MSLHLVDRDVAVICYLHVVAGEAAAWVASSVIVGPVPGLATSLVLVHVVNLHSSQRSTEG